MGIKDRSFPFPQADDFEKVILVLNVENETKLKDKIRLSNYLGDISERQVQYYLSACQYLKLIAYDKKFTELGNFIRKADSTRQIIELEKLLVKDDVFGTVYFYEKVLGTKLERTDVIDIMKEYVNFDSEAMYIRRSQTVIRWVEWINKMED